MAGSGLTTSDLAYLLSSNLVTYRSRLLALPATWHLTVTEQYLFSGGKNKVLCQIK